MASRTIQIENYLPPVVREVDVFRQIAKAQNPEFNLLQSRIVRTFSERFIQTATEYGVKRWESLLLISPKVEDTLEQRKERILSHLNIKTPYTWRMLENMLGAYVGNDNFKLRFDNEQTKLFLTLNWLSFYAYDDIELLIKNVIPSNIVLDMRYANSIDKLQLDVPVYIGCQFAINRTIFIK